ncbi:hypothetical protein [Mycobacterium bourgelatii]|nr:hypothetical protein [Mycobacterium bourgelatii]MCV6975968.1 hypothetical protein [Mycobacterium bourgelatii]
MAARIYLVAAIERPEIDRRPSLSTARVFVCGIVALALSPTGAANNLGG